MRLLLVFSCITGIALLLALTQRTMTPPMTLPPSTPTGTIRSIALGDSYTIGEGVEPEQRWPNLLVRDLQVRGIPIELVANPSRTGWTTADVLERELPVAKTAQPTFATLLIGVNDWVQGVPAEIFRQRLATILDETLKLLPSPRRLITVTIPDFSATPTGARFGGGRDISKGIAEFNSMIIEESKRRDIAVVDIFTLSQGVRNDPSLIADDGLHPSAKEYALWEAMILPVALAALH